MNKYFVCDIQNYIEENSQYCVLLKERFINEEKYGHNLSAIKQGLACLGISDESTKAFEDRRSFIIWLGRRLTEYKGYELPMYIGHKKMGMPIPDGLVEKCPPKIVTLIEKGKRHEHLHKYNKELKEVSFTPEIFLCVHKSFMCARTESLLPNLLSDIERLTFTDVDNAFEKIPKVYFNYLSQGSLAKLIKKITAMLHELRNKMEQELKDIDLYSLRLKEQFSELYHEVEKGLNSIVKNEVERGVDINIITQKTSSLFSRLGRLFLGNIYHLKDYEKRRKEIRQFMQQEKDFRYKEEDTADAGKKIDDIYNEYMFFEKFGPLNKEEDRILSKTLTQEFEQLHRKKSSSVALLKTFETKGLLSVELDFNSIKDAYHLFMRDVIIPQYLCHALFEMVSCFPPGNDQPLRLVTDMANLKLLSLDGKNILKVREKNHDYSKSIMRFCEKYRKCITILVYDIRGSSYMGIKLHNAAKEQRIKYKFAKEMVDIVKKYGGFLLKDTGDGGLVWFAENSSSLYNYLYTESVTGRGVKLRSSIFSGAEFDLIPGCDAAKRAFLCARDMIQRAEEFIRANFMHYREWFAEVAERTLELDGITYALLPPEFKSLFRIGIGIASGLPNKDVVFSANSYGDPDLVGTIIADAHLYSMVHQPGRSMVIADLPTLINMIFNIENFEYLTTEKDFEQYINGVDELRQGPRGYAFTDHKISVVPKGIHYLGELHKSKAIVDAKISEIWLDEDYFYDQHKKKIKLLYEITPIS